MIFAFLIFCGLMIHRNLPPFTEGFRPLVTTGPTSDNDRLMIDGMARCRPHLLWIREGVALSGLIGVLKPALD